MVDVSEIYVKVCVKGDGSIYFQSMYIRLHKSSKIFENLKNTAYY